MTILEQYEQFFRQLGHEQELQYEEYANASLCSLFACGRAYFGNIVGVTNYGQLILHFDTKDTPRLKVPMVVCVVKAISYKKYGNNIASWDCKSHDYYIDYDAHSALSDIIPAFYLKDSKKIGCGMIKLEMVQSVKKALEAHRELKFIMLETLPPTELLFNLAGYIKNHPDDKCLSLTPRFTYDEWKPTEVKSTDNVSERIVKTLKTSDICVLQGPPGTGKSYTLADIIGKMTSVGMSVCVTTQSNASLISLISQDTMQPVITHSQISKTVLSAEEKKKHPFLRSAEKSLMVGKGNLLCTTYYSLSRIINEYPRPIYDLIVIEEASQAFLTAIAAFMKLGKKCLIVGDPMQLPPIVEMVNQNDYKGIDVDSQINGLMTFVCSQNVPAFRMTTSFRLTEQSTNQSKVFYNGHFTSLQKRPTLFNVPAQMKPFFPKEGGTIIHETNGSSGSILSEDALQLISQIVSIFNGYYPKRKLAILSPYVATTKRLQAEFNKNDNKTELLIDTVSRIQGETVDYTIYYIPLRNQKFAFSENLFNVATSRSRSTTLLISDIPLDLIPIPSSKVRTFLSNCKSIDFSDNRDINREEVKLYYPGLENLVDELLDNHVKFSLDGDADLLDHNDIVIASAGMILTEKKIAIDPTDDDSKKIFESAGYRVISSQDFNINDIK